MKTPLIPSQHRFVTRTRAGFTLVELISVMVVISLLLAIAAPGLNGMLSANKLTVAGQNLLFRMSMAQQIAATENHAVEMRFYLYADENGQTGYHASQLFSYNGEDNTSEAIENPAYFGENSVLIPNTVLSPLLSSAGTGAIVSQAADIEPFLSKNASCKRLIFYPDGSTNIGVPLREAYVTLCAPGTGGNVTATPPNYVTLQIDPVTGRVRSYRP